MATVAGPGTLPPDSLRAGGGGGGGGGGVMKVGAKVRRKTPSELRGEQLKRVNVAEFVDESSAPLLSLSNSLMDHVKKPGVLKSPRYIDTRVDGVYPAKKSRLVSVKDSAKENCSVDQTLKSVLALSVLSAQRKELREWGSSSASPEVAENIEPQTRRPMESCSQSCFRGVFEIQSTDGNSAKLETIDMDKALKGLTAQRPSDLPVESCERSTSPSGIYLGDFCSQGIICGQKAPLDLTLKTIFRVVSQSPLNQISRLITSGTYASLHTFPRRFSEDQRTSSCWGTATASSGFQTKALHSWVYPQSTLPASLISVLTSSAAEKGELDFLKKRQSAWEESFRGLYYMLRKKACNIFYVCASQFVVMFTCHDDSGEKKSCNAYISRSTRGLRSLLREHDVCFSMPLCLSKVEQVPTEDLVELSEIEKHNLGQTRRPSSLSDIDSSPQSLLAVTGNNDVHGLYDILLNYRSYLTSLAGLDVPVLYSPIPFANAAISTPEVKCIEMKRADLVSGSTPGLISAGAPLGNSLEIKDAYLPPWIISNIFAALSSLGSFEASFVSEGTSVGLNAALETYEGPDAETLKAEEPKESPNAFGIPETVVSPLLRSGSLKSLKYCNGSYTASVCPA